MVILHLRRCVEWLHKHSQIPLYRALIITDSLLCPWGKKALKFSLSLTRAIPTSHYYEQFALSLRKESP